MTTLPKSFDPFVTHSFTNGSGLTSNRSALPPSLTHPAPLPSPHLRTYQPKAISPKLYPPSDSVAGTDSKPSSLYPILMHPPMPRGLPLASPPPPQIFEQFRKVPPTPDLVLKKKLPVKSKVVSRPK